jgi:hypothetical protein
MNVSIDVFNLMQYASRTGNNNFTLFSESTTCAFDQCGAELGLKTGDVGRHIGLRCSEGLGGTREGPVLGDGHENLQLFEFHPPPR